MSIIDRNTQKAENVRFDLIIVGGGIYGAMLMLEGTRAGLKTLLLEKADFGGSTSFNNLRIIHGGLRYLQTLHFTRIRESVLERHWFLKTYPELVRPLPCLMPLYSSLTKNRYSMAIALRFNDWLSRNRNIGLDCVQRIPNGKVLSAEETQEQFPLVIDQGLKAGALWYDAVSPDCNRLQIEILRWCVSAGGSPLNYMEVTHLLQSDGDVRGVAAYDHGNGNKCEFLAETVINAGGPSCRALSATFDVERPELFHTSLAWNLLLDRAPLSEGALALQPPSPGSRTYFAHSLGGRLFVGTGHAPVNEDELPELKQRQVDMMLSELNLAVPGLELKRNDIIRIFCGEMPVTRAATVALSDKPVIINHQRSGGPGGLFSVSGVKYTTARSTAATVISRVLQSRKREKVALADELPVRPAINHYKLHPNDCPDRGERLRRAKILIETEAPRTLEDLLIRRSNLVCDPDAALAIADDCCEAFGWGDEESAEQKRRLEKSLSNAADAGLDDGA